MIKGISAHQNSGLMAMNESFKEENVIKMKYNLFLCPLRFYKNSDDQGEFKISNQSSYIIVCL